MNVYDGPLHIVRYERLKTHLVDEMKTLMRFLGWTITESHLNCVLRHSEGKFHRQTKVTTFDPWTGVSKDEIDAVLRKIDNWPYSGNI